MKLNQVSTINTSEEKKKSQIFLFSEKLFQGFKPLRDIQRKQVKQANETPSSTVVCSALSEINYSLKQHISDGYTLGQKEIWKEVCTNCPPSVLSSHCFAEAVAPYFN